LYKKENYAKEWKLNGVRSAISRRLGLIGEKEKE